VKYVAVMGMFLGIKVFPALAAAYFICGVVVITLLVLKKLKPRDSIAFSPFLFLGGLYILLHGGAIPWTIL
ncbi:MAG: hypothetical protein K6U74_16670, partial [Firmicutes bacterium]|nr:hypothetical protein [Bacillota bacterium]